MEMNLRQETWDHTRPLGARGRRTKTLIGTGLVMTVLGSLVGGGASAGAASSAGASAAGASASATRSAAVSPASKKRRIDRARPVFSNPTKITNPLFPISKLDHVIQLGEDAGESLRVEIALLPKTRTIKWRGKGVETVVSQFIAYLDGRVAETAVDYFAQADDGSVWYFGEKVSNYEDGVIANHEGSWLAGRDGRPGMIMPADPKVGDVYRPENIPGFVFEEVTVKAINKTVAGPRGPVQGAIRVQERLMDGTTESKVFAPGYGEFRAEAADELVKLAVAVPIDAQRGSAPGELRVLYRGATKIFNAVPSKDWAGISARLESMTAAWDTYRAGDIPTLLESQMTAALEGLSGAVGAETPGPARQAAIEVYGAGLDFLLQYRRVPAIDFDRLDLWGRQLIVDSAAGDRGGVAGDIAVLKTIRARVAHTLGK